jgi:hypothetical protein
MPAASSTPHSAVRQLRIERGFIEGDDIAGILAPIPVYPQRRLNERRSPYYYPDFKHGKVKLNAVGIQVL